jgi:type II secretory pathway pseudopilin PulG
MTWPLVVLILGVLAMAVARDVFLRLHKSRDDDELAQRIKILEATAKNYEAEFKRIDAVVRDQTNRLTLNRRRS